MSVITLNNLQIKTDLFFEKHYNIGTKPLWKTWELKGKRPDNDLKGCYALEFQDGNIKYVGMCISENKLGSRLNNYHKVAYKADNITTYEAKDKVKGLSKIHILGIEKEIDYLVPSIELFLIQELNPEKNVNCNWHKEIGINL